MIDLAAATRDGALSIDGVVMARPAFAVLDVWPLLQGPEQRGDDTRIPGRPGVLSNPRRADAATITLRLIIDGTYRVDGTLASDPRAQVLTTSLYLRQYVTDPTYVGDGTRTATVVTASGLTFSGPVTVGPLRIGEQGGPLARATIQITMPEGYLAVQ